MQPFDNENDYDADKDIGTIFNSCVVFFFFNYIYIYSKFNMIVELSYDAILLPAGYNL